MLALAGGLAVPQPASADPVFLPTIDAFGDGATSQFGIGTAMAGDGTVVVGRIYPTTEGAVQVEVRRPAESFASVTLQPAVADGPSTTRRTEPAVAFARWEKLVRTPLVGTT